MNDRSILTRLPLAAIAVLALLAGCASQPVERARAVPLATAERELPAEQLLNINIVVFDPNVPADPEVRKDERVFPPVRQAEATYMAYNLRRTLEETGHWGAVRVVPDPIASSELMVTGAILASDGEVLELRIRALDATGGQWLDKTYGHVAGGQDYRGTIDGKEPFQPLYNEIANDLLAQRGRLAGKELEQVRQVSGLRFAADIAPDAFSRYLAEERGRYRAVGLPAVDDPMVERIERIRERDNLLIDSLDQHYLAFHQGVDKPYSQWRAVSYQETINFRELQQQARTRKVLGALAVVAGAVALTKSDNSAESLGSQAAIVGGGYLFKTGIDKRREAEMHSLALQEIGESLGGDLEPQAIELEGRTVILNGSAQAQYREWRELLREIHTQETGLPLTSGG